MKIRAFTLIELLCSIAIIAILASMMLPALSRSRAEAKRVSCLNRLRALGIGFHLFAMDHKGQFPMSVGVSDGGSREYIDLALKGGVSYLAYTHFQVLNGELPTPQVVVCPQDTLLSASTFGALRNQNVSYFVGSSPTFENPNSVLAGDSSITNDWGTSPTIVHWRRYQHLRWTEALHRNKGNVLYADAHVEEKDKAWLIFSTDQVVAPEEFILPTQQGTNGLASSRSSRL